MDSISLDTVTKVVTLIATSFAVAVTIVRTVWRAVGSIEDLNRTMTALAQRLGTLDQRFDKLEARQVELEGRLREHDVDIAVIKSQE